MPDAIEATVDDHGVAPVPEDNRPGHRPTVDPDKPLVPHEALRVRSPGDDRQDDGVADEAVTTRFGFAFEPLLVPMAAAVGVLPPWAWVEINADGRLEVRFGPWLLRTTVDNVAGWEITGGYRLLKVAGPPHLSFADRGVTFATNRQSGLCIRFREAVSGLDPLGILRHPAATVTVTSPQQLGAALDRAAS